MRTTRTTLILSLVGLTLFASLAEAGRRNRASANKRSLVAHPSELVFAELNYDAPMAKKYRHELSNGITVFVVEDHGLPLVDVSIRSEGGAYLEAPGMTGLTSTMANQMRNGGAGDYDAEAFDEEIDFLAMNLSIGSSNRDCTASMNVLTHQLDAGLDLMFAALRSPRFEQERLDLYKKRNAQQLERRNDRTPAITGREWRRLLYGPDHFESTMRTAKSLESVTREKMASLHSQIWHPGNLIIAVSGDTDAKTILPKLEERFKGWSEGPELPPVPAPPNVVDRNVYVVNKEDVNQTRVRIGFRSTTWDHEDARPLEVMNRILGGGGFSSRITTRVRSDEGLAYSAGSFWGVGRDYPSNFTAYFQSKNKSVARAISIIMDEFARIREEPVTKEELDTAINYYVESFPQRFSSAQAKAGTFMSDEIMGRPETFWQTYRDEMRAVTAEAVQRVAKEHVSDDKLTVLVVGNIAEVVAGDPDNPDYHLETFAGEDGILEIAMPEPTNMVYPHEPRPLTDEAVVEGQAGGARNL